MRTWKWLFALLLLLSASGAITYAQTDDEPPYLYYYSRMLGGIIVERADGTDSRLIGEDVIPPGLTGIGGPGWSPSGKYFAAYEVRDSGGGDSIYRPYVMDAQGTIIASWLSPYMETLRIEWSPTGENILLLISNRGLGSQDAFLWVIDVEHDRLLVDFGVRLGEGVYTLRNLAWDVPNEQITFYLAPDTYPTNTYNFDTYYRVTMSFDGTTLREPIAQEAFPERNPSPYYQGSPTYYDAYGISPSGVYEATGIHPTILTNRNTGEAIALPIHTQSTTCGAFVWSDDEQHIITVNGTVVAGGGCSSALIGVTNNTGELWRELGRCSWDFSPCFDWLPERVDVSSMPPGSPEPVQLDPVRIEYEDEIVYSIQLEDLNLRMRCDINGNINGPSIGPAEIVDINLQATQYILKDVRCNDAMTGEGHPILAAYDSIHDLLATSSGGRVTIWMPSDESYEQVMQLDSQGFVLEFTEDGEYLRARNMNGWKVYAVEDILAAVSRNQQP